MDDWLLDNPCISVCRFDEAGHCLGCHRSRAEVRGWKRMNDGEKIAVNRRVRPLMKAEDTWRKLKKLDAKLAKLGRKALKLKAKRARLLALADREAATGAKAA